MQKEEFNFKQFETLSWNSNDIDLLIQKIILLKDGVKLQSNSYTSNKNVIDSIELKRLFQAIEQYKSFSDINKPNQLQIKNYIQKELKELKDYQPVCGYQGELKENKKEGYGYYSLTDLEELIGKFKNNNFVEGLALYNNKKSLYYGKFNQDGCQFKGVYYPDLEEKIVCYGEISHSLFKGISITSKGSNAENIEYIVHINTNKYQISINTKEQGVVNFSILNNAAERNIKYTFREKKYLTSVSLLVKKCYFNMSEITKAIVSYEIPSNAIAITKDTMLTILYPENKLYVGHIDPDKNFTLQGDATLFLRQKFHSDYQYKVEGTWNNGILIKGKVFNGDNVLLYDGQFENNQPSVGKYFFGNGEVYEGEFKNFKRNGRGQYKYENGDVFDGIFVDNLPEGDGIFIDSKGMKQEINIKKGIITR